MISQNNNPRLRAQAVRRSTVSRPSEPAAAETQPTTVPPQNPMTRWARRLRVTVAQHPEASVAVAAALGLTVGWWLRRR